MRWILLILICLSFTAKAQYSITHDSTTCMITITRTDIKYQFRTCMTRYVDRPPEMMIFDNTMSFRFKADEITNYATFALLKTDLDSWFVTCQDCFPPVIGGAYDCSADTISISAVVTDESADGANDGEIDITVSGGASPYTYSWADGPTTEDRTGLADGSYIVTATDANSCTGTDTFTVAAGPVALFNNSKSIDLDGSAEYVTVADDPTIHPNTGNPFSLTYWINTDYNGQWQAIWDDREGGTLYGWINQIAVTTGLVRVLIYDGLGNNRIRYNEVDITDGQWHHIGITYDGASSINIYTDGVASAAAHSGTAAQLGYNTPEDVNIGWHSTVGHYAKSKLDQVCLFNNVELTLQEIKELMTIRDVTQFTYYDSLVVYHEYDNDTTGTDGITDLSPAGNHGTMQSGAYTDLQECITWPYDYQLDTTASYQNLTPMQSAADTSFGGFSWNYTGAGEYITVADNDLLSFVSGGVDQAVSASAWVSFPDITNRPIINKANEYLFWINASDKLEVRFIDASTGGYIGKIYDQDLTTAYTIDYENTFFQVGFSYTGCGDTSCIDLYINGLAVDDGDASSGSYTAMENTAAALNIGYDGSLFAVGYMSDVILFDADLGQTEMTAIYSDHGPRDETTTSLASDIVAYYRAYNSTNVSNGVVDQSGNNLHGTPTSMGPEDFVYEYPRKIYDADNRGSIDYDNTEYLQIDDTDSLTFTNLAGTADTSFSVAVWVVAATNDYFLTKADAFGGDREYYMGASASARPIFTIFGGGNISCYRDVDIRNWSEFGLIVYTYDGSEDTSGMNVYYYNPEYAGTNGQIKAVSGTYTGMSNGNDKGRIGLYVSQFFAGNMAHLTIMKGIELTECQVEELYNDGSPQDPTEWTFYQPNFIHYPLNASFDVGATNYDIINNLPAVPFNFAAEDKVVHHPTNTGIP